MALFKCNFFSTTLCFGTDVNVIVPTPDSDDILMDKETNFFYPGVKFQVLYLLHGAYGDYSDWQRLTSIEKYAKEHKIVVVMPSAANSFYQDMNRGNSYLTYITEELPKFIEAAFPVSKMRRHTFVAGLSMGGYGALKAALHRPEKYAACASLSGAIDIVKIQKESDAGEMDGPFKWEAIFEKPDQLEGSDADLFALLEKRRQQRIKLPAIYMSCGTEDFIYENNIKSHEKLSKMGIEHLFEEYPGVHDWTYWDTHIQDVLNWLPLLNRPVSDAEEEDINEVGWASTNKIRREFDEGDKVRDAGLTVPDNIVAHRDISYGPYGEDNLLDVYYTNEVTKCQPTIVNIHGGGWAYGDKELYQFYCMSLAGRGFTVVNFNYRLAPEHHYPAALEDVNAVFHWMKEHAEEYMIDIDKLFTVGDSAGGQLSLQYLTLLTNKEYQKLFSFTVPENISVKATGLNCGFYNTKEWKNNDNDRLFESYLGENAKQHEEELDVFRYLTDQFPPAYIMTATKDFIKSEALPLYEVLKGKGVPCEYHLYGDETHDLFHVFHVGIKSEDAGKCNDAECEFFRKWM